MQVELQAVGGALHMLFLDNVIGNAYQNLSNIVLTIRPRELGSPKAVLVGSHYDSIIGSRGGPFTSPHSNRPRCRKNAVRCACRPLYPIIQEWAHDEPPDHCTSLYRWRR